MNGGVRDRSRALLRAELADAAADFCAEHGFEHVTADEIAQGIGISRATFFRYFASKEDAVVAAVRTGRTSLGAQLRAAAPAPGTAAMDAVRASLAPTVALALRDPRKLRARIRMIGSSAPLRTRLASERAEQRDDLAAALLELVPDRAEALAAATASMAAIDLAWSLWTADDDADFDETLARAFALVQGAGGIAIGRPAAR